MIKVYISSPYSEGDPIENVKRQTDMANILIDLGYNPFIPLLSHYIHIENPKPYFTWLRILSDWIPACDALLRLPGNSQGADFEEHLAKICDVPVFYSVEELIDQFKL